MFTGIIEATGRIVIPAASAGKTTRIGIETPWLDGIGVSDSVAVNGACLTVTKIDDRVIRCDVGGETIAATTLGMLRAGHIVNLERAMRAGDRFGGHLVTGHVDTIAEIRDRRVRGGVYEIVVGITVGIEPYLVPKGSIAVDGISLTIQHLDEKTFTVHIIPLTGRETTLGSVRTGDAVNIEVDIIGKYVRRMLDLKRPAHEHQLTVETVRTFLGE